MSDDKKYELLQDRTKRGPNGCILYQIRALREVSDFVNAGDIGGYVELEKNLSHAGKSWVYRSAVVCDNARVYGDAEVFGSAVVWDNAAVSGNAQLHLRDSIVWFSNVGSEYGTLTVAIGCNDEVFVTRGCFSGTLLEFLEEVNKRHGNSRNGREYRALIAVSCSRLGVQTPSSITPIGG